VTAVSEKTAGAIGAAALLALIAEIVLLPRLTPIDDVVWRALLLARSCGTDAFVERFGDVVSIAVGALLASAAALHVVRYGIASAWPPLAVSLIGLLAGSVMKRVFARGRPSNLPDATLGFSFPSGHVMNTALAAIAIVILTRHARHAWWWRVVALLLLASVVAARMSFGRHWTLDVTASLLAATAAAGLCLGPVRRAPVRATLGIMLALASVLAVEASGAFARIRLPSSLSVDAPGVVSAVLEALTNDQGGGWRERSYEHPAGPLVWLDGHGTVALDVPEAPNDGARPSLVVIAGRPAVPDPRCPRVAVEVNGREIARFVAYRGWREYRFPVPPRALRRGTNEVAITTHDGDVRGGRFAVTYVRLVPRR
jgi:membrane-associated phospholipid phosphatase